jgi:hypothetical protein
MIRSMDTRDKNDPQLLGEAILATRDKFSCSIVQAADRVYEEMRENGWSYAPFKACVPLASPGFVATSAAPGSPEQDDRETALDAHGDHTDEPT